MSHEPTTTSINDDQGFGAGLYSWTAEFSDTVVVYAKNLYNARVIASETLVKPESLHKGGKPSLALLATVWQDLPESHGKGVLVK